MTREEATYLLNNLRSVAEGEEDEAIDMAIEALTSKNLTEPNNTCEVDLINRADAIEAVVCHIWHTPPETRKMFNCENYVRYVVEEALKPLPSADTDMSEYCDRLWKIAYERGKAETEAKTGEWVEHTGGISHELYYFCDQCYGEVDTNDYNFCPNCGARMKGGDTE